jgi:beta-xylosidase
MVRESTSGVSEGSHLFKQNGYYYLFTAEGGTESGHCEWVMRSKESPFGPYELGPANPLWRNSTLDEIQNTGHCDLVQDVDGRWWAVSLGVRPLKVDGSFQTSVFGKPSLVCMKPELNKAQAESRC